MPKAAFLTLAQLAMGMNVAILQPTCLGCGLWQEVTRGKITRVTRSRAATSIEVKGTTYSLAYATARKVVLAGEARQWTDLAKSIRCSH